MFIGHFAVSLGAEKYASEVSLSVLGPPPTSEAWTAQGLWLVVAWGFWIDRYAGACMSQGLRNKL